MRRFLMLLALFVVGALVQSRVFPPMEGSDEPLHITYVMHLRQTGSLPDRATYLENCTRQQAGQPPLVYGLGAALLDVLRIPSASCDAVFDYYYRQTNNPWLLSPAPYRPDDNNTNFLRIRSAAPPPGYPATVYTLRLLSVMFGALAVAGAWLAAGEVFTQPGWRLTATAIFAFTPTFFHLSSYYSNDPAAAAFTALVIWQALALLRRGITPRRLLLVGLFAGVGALAKVSVALAVPAVAVAVLWRAWRDQAAWFPALRQMISAGLVAAVPFVLTFGLWAGWGWVTYSDPLGTGTHTHPTLNYDPPLSWAETARGLPDVYRTYVGLLGYANVYMSPLVVGLVLAPVGLALAGVVLRPRRLPWDVVTVLLVLAGGTFAGFLGWYRTIFDVTGRLLMPAHLAYALGGTLGLMLLARWLPGRWLRAGTVAAHLLAGGLLTFVTLHAAYAPPLTTDPPPLAGPTYTFDDTIRLLGYHTPTPQLTAEIHPITLCWEVLQPTDRLAAYTVRYVKDGVPAAQRTTVHGLGRYNSTLWQAGDRFCDRLAMPVGDERFGAVPPEAGATYDILVFLLDARSGDVNWGATAPDGTPVQFPVLGQVVYPE